VDFSDPNHFGRQQTEQSPCQIPRSTAHRIGDQHQKNYERANMEAFLENILMLLPALRIDSFVKDARPEPPTISGSKPVSDAPLFELRVPDRGVNATARLIGAEFVVQKGSVTAKSWDSRYDNTTYAHLYAELVKTGTLQEQGEQRVFTENYAFSSTSAAASVVNGRPWSGPVAWKLQGQQKTYKMWEAEKLALDSSGER
jgi:hypothetical protein